MITYFNLCKKLGFDVLSFNPETSGTEDDNRENPFKILSLDEIDFLLAYIAKNKKKHANV